MVPATRDIAAVTNHYSEPLQEALLPRSLDLAVILPTYNERGNVAELVARLEVTLGPLSWELIFVDDDSPDGTADVVADLALRDPRIRLLHRIGRRGLSSACIEGILASSAPVVAVMDADLQHDESVLPEMLERLRNESLDVVVGTRNAQNGSMGEFGRKRIFLSQLGRCVSRSICRLRLSDPMSGFFMLRRSFFMELVHRLQGNGFKILVDILASSRAPVQLGEVGYRFRERQHGESKLDAYVGMHYLFLIGRKLSQNVASSLILASLWPW